MESALPPQIQAAQAQLLAAIESVDKQKIDPLKTPWADLEKSVIKLLGGAFALEKPEHQVVALGLSALLGSRLADEHQAFYFPNRDSMDGISLGFPEALVMLSPFGAVLDALRAAKLERLEEVTKDIRNSLAQVKFSAAGPRMRLGPADYQRLFDPGYVQLISLDPTRAASTWDATPSALARDLKDALTRVGPQFPAEAKPQVESQLVGALQRLDPAQPLKAQVDRAPRVAELMGHLFATTQATGAAPEEFWEDVAMPLVHIGAPDQFPPLEQEELDAAKQGLDPFFLFLDVVPFKHPAPEEGLLGAFAADEVQLPSPVFAQVQSLRLIKVSRDRLKGLVDSFDAKAFQGAVDRFQKTLEEKSGTLPPPRGEGAQLLPVALNLVEELRKVLAAPGDLCLRRLTEAEAASEGVLGALRGALQGPRLILV